MALLASNGAAIINGAQVPPSEVRVLEALTKLRRPAIVSEVSSALKEVLPHTLSDSALYTLLGRLAQRGLVSRSEETVEVPGTQIRVRRLFWTPHFEAQRFFLEERERDEAAININKLLGPSTG